MSNNKKGTLKGILENIGNRIKFSSVNKKEDIEDDEVLPKVMKNEDFKSVPFDCIGEILQFTSDSKVLLNLLLLSKGVNSYLNNNPHSTQFIKFNLFKIPKKKMTYVRKLNIPGRMLDIKIAKKLKDKDFAQFSNLKSLKIQKSKTLTDKLLKYVPNLEKLKIINCTKFRGDGIKNLRKLRYLEVENTYFEMEDGFFIDFKEIKNLETLIFSSLRDINISMFKYLENLKILKLNNSRFSFLSIADQIEKKFPVFRQMKDLETLIIHGRTNINYETFAKELKDLQNLKQIEFERIARFFSRTKDVFGILHESYQQKSENSQLISIKVSPLRMKRGKFKRPTR